LLYRRSEPNFFGDAIVGNYDIAFVADTTFNFGGGGLIVDFFNTGGVDNSFEQNLVWSSNNPIRFAATLTDSL